MTSASPACAGSSRPRGGPARRVARHRRRGWHALLLTALALASCGTTSSQNITTQGSGGPALGRPIATTPAITTTSSSTSSSSTTAAKTNRAATTTVPPAESIHLPPPPHATAPRSRAILHIATRFANAYLLYQIGRDPSPVKQAIRQTCTPSFARVLLSQPVGVPATQRHSPAEQAAELGNVTYTGPATLGPGPPVQIVIARYHTIGHPNIGGQLTLEVTASRAGWRVASLR